MQWIRPAEGVVRVVNQVLKLASVGAGVYVAVGKGCEGGLMKGKPVRGLAARKAVRTGNLAEIRKFIING